MSLRSEPRRRQRRLVAAAAVGTIVAGVTGLASPASAVAVDLVLVSTSDAGVKGNGASYDIALSADQRTATFWSLATNLDPADTDTMADVYVKDLTSGELTLVSTSDRGRKANNASYGQGVSADGGTVAMLSRASNLDPADTDNVMDVYVKALASGDIMLASTSDTGVKGAADCWGPTLSANGQAVTFYTGSNLDPADTDPNGDVYVKNLASGDIVLASTSDTGVKSNGSSWYPSLSADAATVAFYSTATNLDPGDTDALLDVYVKDLASGDTVLASTSDTGVKSNGDSWEVTLSADGRTVAFTTDATNLDPADTDREWDVYVKDLATGELTLASTLDTGIKGNGQSYKPSLSAHGNRVAFSSAATNLDPRPPGARGIVQVYVKDLKTLEIVLASSSEAGVKGKGSSSSAFLAGDGTTVAFSSSAPNLDPADSDTISDVYLITVTSPGGP